MARAEIEVLVPPRWQRRPDDRPRLLMASALKLLRRDGYRRIRLEDVAADAGVCKATVYHYFASKDDLLTRSVAYRMAERQLEMARKLALAGGSATERLRLFLHEFWTMSLAKQSGLWQRLVVSEVANDAPEVFTAWAHGLVERWRFVETLIKEGQVSGEFRPTADAEVVARLIVSALSHQALLHVHLGVRRLAPCDVDRLFESSMDHLMNGLRPAGARSSKRKLFKRQTVAV